MAQLQPLNFDVVKWQSREGVVTYNEAKLQAQHVELATAYAEELQTENVVLRNKLQRVEAMLSNERWKNDTTKWGG